ncbi:MAG: hypothetical protein IJD70_09245 [Clostridia bacterium]|nr:hypothetical protein [Clostridia bacterium]
MKNEMIKDTRLLEALDYIDTDLIGDVAVMLKLPSMTAAEPVRTWKTPFKYWKQFTALAACMVLLSVIAPMLSNGIPKLGDLIASLGGNSAAGVGTVDDMSDVITDENGVPYTYPMFVDDLELLTVQEMLRIDELWYKRVYDNSYKEFYDFYINNVNKKYSESEASELADKRASQFANEIVRHCFFNEQYYHNSRYYGTINDCVILVSVGMAAVMTEYKIAGYTISFSNSASIYVIKDDAILRLEEAYDLGYLTDDNIALISERHNDYNSYLKNTKIQGE